MPAMPRAFTVLSTLADSSKQGGRSRPAGAPESPAARPEATEDSAAVADVPLHRDMTATALAAENRSPARDALQNWGVPALLAISTILVLRDAWRWIRRDGRRDGRDVARWDDLNDRFHRLEQRFEQRPSLAASVPPRQGVDVGRAEFLDVRDSVASLVRDVEGLKRELAAARTPAPTLPGRGVQMSAPTASPAPPPRAPALSVEVDDQGMLRLSHALTAMAMAETGAATGAVAVRLNPERFFENAEIGMWTQFFDFPNDKATAAMYRTTEPALVSYANGEFGRIQRKGRVERTQ